MQMTLQKYNIIIIIIKNACAIYLDKFPYVSTQFLNQHLDNLE